MTIRYGAIILTLGWVSGLAFCATQYEWKDGKWVPMTAPAKGSPEGELAMIRQLVENGQNAQAVKAADVFLKAYDTPQREEVTMLAGQAEINRERYYQAFEWFEKLLAEWPTGAYSERALLREFFCAEQFLKGKKRVIWGAFFLPATDEGVEILGRIAEHVPGTELAEKALLRIGEYHMAAREFSEAAEAYDRYLQFFPRGKRAEYAALQAAQATLSSFRGTTFDETPLIEAEQRFREFGNRYPVGAERANVSGILQNIKNQRAQKTFETAQFYERLHHPQAAAYYYREVDKKFPDTSYASLARSALKSLPPPPLRPEVIVKENVERPRPASAPASGKVLEQGKGT